jgi:general secretion pathway protein K
MDYSYKESQPAFDGKEDGFVLVSVIWIAGLLAVIATAFAITVRSHTLGGSNNIYNTQAEYAADGMALFTALKLASPASPAPQLEPNGEPVFCNWSEGATVSVSVQDQGGLVDLNTASPELLDVLFRSLGADAGKSISMIGALQNFRDPDSLTSDGAAEPVTFPGKTYGPKNAPFAITAEIDQIPEIDEAMFHRLMPLVTVYSQQSGIDPAVAPQHLLELLGATGETATSPTRFSSPSPAKTFSIDVTAELKNGARYRRLAIISILRQPDRPFATLEWTRGGDSGDPARLPNNGSACIN